MATLGLSTQKPPAYYSDVNTVTVRYEGDVDGDGFVLEHVDVKIDLNKVSNGKVTTESLSIGKPFYDQFYAGDQVGEFVITQGYAKTYSRNQVLHYCTPYKGFLGSGANLTPKGKGAHDPKKVFHVHGVSFEMTPTSNATSSITVNGQSLTIPATFNSALHSVYGISESGVTKLSVNDLSGYTLTAPEPIDFSSLYEAQTPATFMVIPPDSELLPI